MQRGWALTAARPRGRDRRAAGDLSNQDPHNIAVTPDGTLAVAVGSFDVGVLSLASGSVAKTISGGGRSVAIATDGKRELVTLGSTLRVVSLQL